MDMGLFGWLFGRKKKPHVPPVAWEPDPAPAPTATVDSEGRRHLENAPYLLPKDEQEIHRLDYQHYILRQVLKGNTFAPVEGMLRRGCNVLDVGCGTGRWAKELATTYPKTQVIGFDLEEVTTASQPPPNYQFQRGNLLTGLPFTTYAFAYVHQRLLVAAIPSQLWPFVVSELVRVTQPGGWVELVEMGTAVRPCGAATAQMIDWWNAISQKRGIDLSKTSQIGNLLKHAGLSHVKAETKLLPLGGWGGRIGHLLSQDFLAVVPSLRPIAEAQLGVSPVAFTKVLDQLEWEWNTLHSCYEAYFARGQV
jgi:SAM-dependent methyltransferase